MASVGSSVYLASQQIYIVPKWGYIVGLTSIVMSLAVNALVTGLIAFKIFKVYQEVKPLYDHPFGGTGGSKLLPIIFIIIESGLALFSIQLAWLVVNMFQTQVALIAAQPILSIQRMLNVTISSAIFSYNLTDKFGLVT